MLILIFSKQIWTCYQNLKWESNGRPSALFFPFFSPHCFCNVSFCVAFFRHFFQALRCLQMPLSGFSIETRSDRGDLYEMSRGQWVDLVVSLEMWVLGPRLGGNSKDFFIGSNPQKNWGKIRTYSTCAYVFQDGLNGTNQAVKMTVKPGRFCRLPALL